MNAVWQWQTKGIFYRKYESKSKRYFRLQSSNTQPPRLRQVRLADCCITSLQIYWSTFLKFYSFSFFQKECSNHESEVFQKKFNLVVVELRTLQYSVTLTSSAQWKSAALLRNHFFVILLQIHYVRRTKFDYREVKSDTSCHGLAFGETHNTAYYAQAQSCSDGP